MCIGHTVDVHEAHPSNTMFLCFQTLPPEQTFDCCNIKAAMTPDPDIVQEEPYYFTMPFQFDKLELCVWTNISVPDPARLVTPATFTFRFDFDPSSEDERLSFFTNAERSLVVKEILDRTSFVDEDSTLPRYGSLAPCSNQCSAI